MTKDEIIEKLRGHLKYALPSLEAAHWDRCINSDKCECVARAKEIRKLFAIMSTIANTPDAKDKG